MKFILPLLVLVPIALVLEFAHIGGPTAVFAACALSLIPLAGLLGHATEEAAVYTGPKIGTLLNADLRSEHGPSSMKRPAALGLMAVTTIGIVFMSELLVGAVEPVAEQWGLSELFMGAMLIPLVRNIAEHIVAVQVACQNKMDLSLDIAIGSGFQLALFVTPVLVLISVLHGKPDDVGLQHVRVGGADWRGRDRGAHLG